MDEIKRPSNRWTETNGTEDGRLQCERRADNVAVFAADFPPGSGEARKNRPSRSCNSKITSVLGRRFCKGPPYTRTNDHTRP